MTLLTSSSDIFVYLSSITAKNHSSLSTYLTDILCIRLRFSILDIKDLAE